MPTYRRGTIVWDVAATAEDAAESERSFVVPQVISNGCSVDVIEYPCRAS